MRIKTREASAKPWAEVPEPNRLLMMSTVAALIARGVIVAGPGPMRGGG